jgi:predicted ArsR family transcriptional regulator
MPGMGDPAQEPARLEVLKALGDNTRYAIYLELARSASPRSTADIADVLGLHPNTVRPHLERMREVGLLDVQTDPQGSVGRPQHRYSLAADAPSLGLEPPAFPLLAHLLAAVAAAADVAPEAAATAAAPSGRALAAQNLARTPDDACVAALADALDGLGFDPAVAADGEEVTIAFTHCPFRELAEAYPELVCHLHRGLVEGFVERAGGCRVQRFNTLADRDPCQVELTLR